MPDDKPEWFKKVEEEVRPKDRNANPVDGLTPEQKSEADRVDRAFSTVADHGIPIDIDRL